jgi:enediyne biosynthesis protein E4
VRRAPRACAGPALLLALAGTSGCAALPGRVVGAQSSGGSGFRESARASGIDFAMRFLPNEQGQTYKVNLYDHGCGLAVGDVNGDGHDDVYFLNQMGRNALYQNRGDGTFVEVTEKAGVGLGDRICVGATLDDYDNDGDQDLYVTSTRGGNVLFQNQGDGTFRDVTASAGLTHVGHSQTPVFFDADRDGKLDLFVTNTAEWTTGEFVSAGSYYVGQSGLAEMARSPKESNLLYRNNGDGTFTNMTSEAGLRGKGWGGDVVAFDYDEDGWMDLLVTNMFGQSQLYRNQGKGRFADVTRKTLGRTSWGAIGAKALDYNGDGRLDLFITDMHSDMWMSHTFSPSSIEEYRKYPYVTGAMNHPTYGGPEKIVAEQLGIRYEEVLFGNTLFRNEGKGKFTEVSDEAGMETFWPWGIASGDFDNDQDVDVFIPTGMGYPYFYWRNYLMMNDGTGKFADRSREHGIEPPPGGTHQPERIAGKPAARSSRCAVVSDFDGDGRLDLMTNNFNDRPYYLRNGLDTGNYLRLALTGTRSNRDGIGAVLRLYAGKQQMVRQVDAAGGYLSRGSKVVHFGLGQATRVDRVEVQWPGGARQTLKRPGINTLHRITEPRE